MVQHLPGPKKKVLEKNAWRGDTIAIAHNPAVAETVALEMYRLERHGVQVTESS